MGAASNRAELAIDRELTGDRFRSIREGLSLSQVRFAAALGVTPKTLRRHEATEGKLPLTIALAVAALVCEIRNAGTDEDTPTGKRSTRRSARGNLIGYAAGRRWTVINGCGVEPYSEQETRAETAWLAGRTDWKDAAWE